MVPTSPPFAWPPHLIVFQPNPFPDARKKALENRPPFSFSLVRPPHAQLLLRRRFWPCLPCDVALSRSLCHPDVLPCRLSTSRCVLWNRRLLSSARGIYSSMDHLNFSSFTESGGDNQRTKSPSFFEGMQLKKGMCGPWGCCHQPSRLLKSNEKVPTVQFISTLSW